jgi:ribosomal protein S18 acetylase RimI-like enzyme
MVDSSENSEKVDAFEKKEWRLADMKHYGKLVDFTKKKHKFIAKKNSTEIIGTLDLVIEANLAYVDSLLVGSQFQKMGVGRKLIEIAENFARDKKCTKVWLETNEGWGAEKFYKKIGYEVTGIHEKHILNQKTLILTKFL